MPDNDAIDYDDVENGIIRNSVIHDFLGFNSDAVDIGEKAKNIFIENLLVYNVVDKGVSVGQQSSAAISNSVFVNCNIGAGFKRFLAGFPSIIVPFMVTELRWPVTKKMKVMPVEMGLLPIPFYPMPTMLHILKRCHVNTEIFVFSFR